MNDRKSRLAEIRELAKKLEGTPPGLDPVLFEELLKNLRAPKTSLILKQSLKKEPCTKNTCDCQKTGCSK
jgi:hypothetical protein